MTNYPQANPAARWRLIAIIFAILFLIVTVSFVGYWSTTKLVLGDAPKFKEQVEAWQKATIAAQAALAREVSNSVNKDRTISEQQTKLLELQMEVTKLTSQLARTRKDDDAPKTPATNPK